MTGLVVRMETLRLESHKETAIFSAGILKDQASILIHTVVTTMPFVIPLVHVDIMNAISGKEFEVLILLLCFRTPSRPEGVNQSAFLSYGGDHGVFHRVFQIVVGSGNITRHYLEIVLLDDATPDEILRQSGGFAGQFCEAGFQRNEL